MKDSMNAVFGHALEQISQEPAIAKRVKGKLGSALASATVAGALAMAGLLASGSAAAQNYPGQSGGLNTGCVIGSVAGGLLGNQIGGGNGKTAATALGAVAGCVTGSSIQNNNEQGQPQRAHARQAYRQPARGYQNHPQPAYPQPAAHGRSHPMSSYAPACMAQWSGESQPSRPLSREASVALGKGESMLSESFVQARDAQQDYASAYSNFQRVKQGEANPYNNMNGGDTMAIRDSAARAHADLNKMSRFRQNAEREYAGNTLRVLDACEFAASQGEDVRSFAKLQSLMTLPMADQWTLRHPITGANVRIVTGGQPARLPASGYDGYEQPRNYRP